MEEKLSEIEEYAKEKRIPIMMMDGIEFLCNYIKEHKIKRILEIGSAIGYSAIKMALIDKDIKIVTIERDKERYDEAIKNINDFNLNEQIKIINGDAMDVSIDGMYDLIFIDASKGHNIDFFEKYQNNLDKNGVIITDNLSFHGLVEDESLIETKNQRGIVGKIKMFIDYLDNNKEFITEYVAVGDRISISKRI
ncbi:MAG: O-methyltransferase [Bacilli bacterium]